MFQQKQLFVIQRAVETIDSHTRLLRLRTVAVVAKLLKERLNGLLKLNLKLTWLGRGSSLRVHTARKTDAQTEQDNGSGELHSNQVGSTELAGTLILDGRTLEINRVLSDAATVTPCLNFTALRV